MKLEAKNLWFCGNAPRKRALRAGMFGLAAAALAVGAVWWAGTVRSPQLSAQVAELNDDTDGDGVCDLLEATLGTWACHADTDGDGFSDSEELARRSNPTDPNSFPTVSEPSLQMVAYEDHRGVHVNTFVYVHDGEMRELRMRYGARIGERTVGVPMEALRGGEPVSVRSGRRAGSKVLRFDPMLSRNAVMQRRGLSLFATIANCSCVRDADACNLAVSQGEIYQMLRIPTGNTAGLTAPSGGNGIGLGNAYRPIRPSTSVPSNAMGEICAQTTVVVRVIGAVVTQEVVAADCVPGWETYCSPGCANTVGTTIRAVDPAALIGG